MIGAVQLVGVEDVQRPGAVVGDEVGDVDERRDRPEADRAQPVLQPLRRRAVRHAADQPADEERAGLAGDVGREVDGDRAGEARRATGSIAGVISRPRPRAARSRAMPATPSASGRFGVTAISITGSNGDDVDVAGADRGVGGELDDAVVLVGELHLALGEHHAVALDAADPADLDRGVDAGDVVAGRGDHDLDAGAGVRGAADDLLLAVARSATRQTRSLSASGCGRASSTSPTVKAASRVGRVGRRSRPRGRGRSGRR